MIKLKKEIQEHFRVYADYRRLYTYDDYEEAFSLVHPDIINVRVDRKDPLVGVVVFHICIQEFGRIREIKDAIMRKDLSHRPLAITFEYHFYREIPT